MHPHWGKGGVGGGDRNGVKRSGDGKLILFIIYFIINYLHSHLYGDASQSNLHSYCIWWCCSSVPSYTGWPPKKRNSGYSQFFRTLLWSTVIFFTLLDRASFPHYNNTKIMKFGYFLWSFIFGICPISRVPRHD